MACFLAGATAAPSAELSSDLRPRVPEAAPRTLMDRPTADLTSAVLIQRRVGLTTDTAINSRGQIVADGKFFLNTGDTSDVITRLNPDGSVDNRFLGFVNTVFPSDPSRPRPGVFALAVDPSDRTLVAWGIRNDANEAAGTDIVRLLPTGEKDRSFSTGVSFGFQDDIETMVLQPDGKILVGGRFSQADGDKDGNLFRLNPNGSPDSGFSDRSRPDIPFDVGVFAVGLLPRGRILVGRHGWTPAGDTRITGAESALAVLNTDGSIARPLPREVRNLAKRGVYAIAIARDGRAIIGGTSLLMRVNADGTLDRSFSQITGKIGTTVGQTYTIRSIAIQTDGRILVGGHFASVNGVPTRNLIRLMPDGAVDADFARRIGSGFVTQDFDQSGVSDIEIEPDGRIVVAGPFEQVNGNPVPSLARLNADGSLDKFPVYSGTGLK